MFEFSTEEQREAWRVIEPLYSEAARSLEFTARECLCQAAARFDQREATCGIEPLSEKHFALGACCGMCFYPGKLGHAIMGALAADGLLKTEHYSKENNLVKFTGTDKGRTVLQRLNAMCKVER